MTISAINLGSTFTNSNGTSVLSGVSSGINTEATINSLVAAQSSQITTLNNQITSNNTQITALNKLQTLLTNIQTAAAQLSDPQSPDATTNAFAAVTTSITSNTTQAASNFLSATAAADTPTGTYTISNITQLATATSQTASTTFSSATATAVASSATASQFTAGTYTISGPKGAGTVTLSSGDSLTQVATDFNNATSTTGIAASVLQTSAGVYTLVFTSTITGGGAGYDFDLSNGTATTVTDGNGNALSLGDISFASPKDGQNAEFDLNGVPITRANNTVSDLISGVTLNLLQNTSTQPGASFTLSVGADTTGISNVITNFANAYNAFLTFYAQQTALNSNGTPASSAILYSDTTLQNVYNKLTSEASSIVRGLSSGSGSSTVSQFSDIGISLTTGTTSGSGSSSIGVNNVLSIDTTALTAALQNNLSGVEKVFGYNLTSSSPNLVSYQNATDPSINKYSVNVTQSTVPPTYTVSYTDSSGATQTVSLTASSLGSSGVALTAPSTSALAGLILIYTGTGDQSNISVSTSEGIAAQMNNFLTTALTTNTGLLATDETAINTRSKTLQTQITNVTTQVANTRTELLQKYAALESAISSANSTLNLLNANQLAQSSSGG